MYFGFKNEATRANLQVNTRKLNWRPFWNKVYVFLKLNIKFFTITYYLNAYEKQYLKLYSVA